MPFMNFIILNAKNIEMEFKKLLKYGITIHWGFNYKLSWSHRDIKWGLWKKPGR